MTQRGLILAALIVPPASCDSPTEPRESGRQYAQDEDVREIRAVRGADVVEAVTRQIARTVQMSRTTDARTQE